MSNFVNKPNTGKLWKNDRKTEEKHPDLSGESSLDKQFLMDMIAKGEDPVRIQVSAYKNKTKDGRPYLGLSFSEPFVAKKKEAPAPKNDILEDDEDVPF